MAQAMPTEQYQIYYVWDAPTRWFHWINALAVIGLTIVGVVLLNDGALGISAGGKILLKQIHVVLGYVMAANLIWRFVCAFLGNRYARWPRHVALRVWLLGRTPKLCHCFPYWRTATIFGAQSGGTHCHRPPAIVAPCSNRDWTTPRWN